MGRKSNSLQHELIKRVLPQIENNLTGTAYKKHIKKFASWREKTGIGSWRILRRRLFKSMKSILRTGRRNMLR